MYFVPRNSTAQRVKNIEILVSSDNIGFTSVGTTQIPNAFSRYEFVFPNGPVYGKFFKVLLKDGWNTPVASFPYAAMAELGVIK